MKLKKILLAATAVSLVAGNAHALTSTVLDASGDGFTVLPNELNLAAAAATVREGTLRLDVRLTNATSTFPTSTNTVFTITLPANVVFSRAMTGADILGGSDATATEGVPLAANINSGGTAGSSTVEIFYSAGANDREVDIILPVRVTACPTSGSQIVVSASNGGTAIEPGDALANVSNAITCRDTFTVAGMTDVAGGANNSEIALVDYQLFTENNSATTSASTPVGNVTSAFAATVAGATTAPGNVASVRTVGTVAITTAAGDNIADGSPGGTANTAAAAVAPVATAPGDATSTSYVVALDNVVGLRAAAAGGPVTVAGATVAAVAGSTTQFTATAAGVGVGSPITIFADTTAGAVPMTAKTVNATGLTVNLNTALGYNATDSGSNAALDALERDGRGFGPYDWNNESGAVNSVYRITGLSTTSDTPMTITYSNSNAGAAFNTTVSGTVAAADVTNGEYIITSRGGLSTMNAGYQRADVSFFFETGNAVDVDRLISSNGDVGNFGNAANGDD